MVQYHGPNRAPAARVRFTLDSNILRRAVQDQVRGMDRMIAWPGGGSERVRPSPGGPVDRAQAREAPNRLKAQS
jgi:hypothetical protein